MEKIKVTKISSELASSVLTAARVGDPAKRATPESIAANGECFEMAIDGQTGVFVLEQNGQGMWISGAGAVATEGLAVHGLSVIEAIAKKYGSKRVAFQTERPGLVKLAKKQGYKTVGFIMEKELT